MLREVLDRDVAPDVPLEQTVVSTDGSLPDPRHQGESVLLIQRPHLPQRDTPSVTHVPKVGETPSELSGLLLRQFPVRVA